MGRTAKSEKAAKLLWDIYNAIRAIAREEGVAPTLSGIAEQLNRRGLRTNRGNPFDFRKVGAALDKLGLDRVAIIRWKQQARDKAQEWQVPAKVLYAQLWHEWQQHVGTSQTQFVPNLVHPNDWVPPWKRDAKPDWRMIHPPPQARLVHIFLGAFEREQDDLS